MFGDSGMGGDHSRFFCSPSPVIASGRSGAAPDMNLADEPENPGMSRLLALENSARRLVKANPSRFFFFSFLSFSRLLQFVVLQWTWIEMTVKPRQSKFSFCLDRFLFRKKRLFEV
jgi:hypothetical protein